MDSRDHFSLRVGVALRARNLTLRGLCREAGLDPSFFSKVLAGKRSPPAEEAVLRRIAQVLQLDAVELIVSAGRIPAEWQALKESPRLVREVHALATGARAAEAPAGRAPARLKGEPAAHEGMAGDRTRQAGKFSEELL